MNAVAPPSRPTVRRALRFVVLLGIVSLLADVTYEGARGVIGPFLGTLGAGAAVVGTVAGLGELVGWGLRLVSGHLADRTRRYWLITITGYAVNLLAVPLLALAGRWEVAAGLIVAERAGKAIRTPARDAMLSHATQTVGHGWGFGLHEALDQTGALVGPLVVGAVLWSDAGYAAAFALLAVPALLALGVLAWTRRRYPAPADLEVRPLSVEPAGLRRPFWIYLAGAACVALGYADFALIAWHFAETGRFAAPWIPLTYALAMAVDGVAALAVGRLFDRIGVRAVAAGSVLAAGFAPLVFFGGPVAALAGVALWGVGMGVQESALRATVAALTPAHRRGAAFGLFGTVYGVAWFVGSVLLGVLYEWSLTALVVVSMAAQIIAVPLLLAARRRS